MGADGAAPAAAAAARPELTELSSGLLQLLDLVLQHEHGHCECQQRQKLQLGRHHDSEQPHQIIHIECLVSSCSVEAEEVLEEEEEKTQETHTLVAAVTKRRSVRAWPCLRGSACLSPNVRIFWF